MQALREERSLNSENAVLKINILATPRRAVRNR
jgi:hypothetical protein